MIGYVSAVLLMTTLLVSCRGIPDKWGATDGGHTAFRRRIILHSGLNIRVFGYDGFYWYVLIGHPEINGTSYEPERPRDGILTIYSIDVEDAVETTGLYRLLEKSDGSIDLYRDTLEGWLFVGHFEDHWAYLTWEFSVRHTP
jgi:hypothetical protein